MSMNDKTPARVAGLVIGWGLVACAVLAVAVGVVALAGVLRGLL